MDENRFAPAGWMAIAGAILTLPLMGMGFLFDILVTKLGGLHPLLPLIYVALGVAQATLVIYAFYRFKVYLNETHEFHRTDVLMMAIIAGAIVITTIGLSGRFITWMGAPIPVTIAFVAGMVLVGVPVGILSVIFGIKVLEIEDTLHGLLKPYAFLNIVAGVCFATFILSPLGLLIGAVGDVVMGMILLRSGAEAVPDFV